MTDELLADVDQKGKKIDSDEDLLNLGGESDEQDDVLGDSPSQDDQPESDPSQEGEEQKDDAQNTSDEDNIPFNKHPRWQELQRQNEEMQRQLEELSGLAGTVDTLKAEQEKAHKGAEPLPDEWVQLYGDDDASRKAYGLFQTQFSKMESSVMEKIKQEQEQAQKQAQEHEQTWNKWVDDEVAALEAKGEKFDKNKLLKVAVDMRPTDEEGNISLPMALEILKLQEAQASPKQEKQIQKNIAAKTSSDNRGGGKQTAGPSSNSLRSKSFSSLAQETD